MNTNEDFKIIDLIAQDIRWPTSLQQHGSDAMHTDPDYSCVYVTIKLFNGLYGNGITFTLGRGTEVVQKACEALKHLVLTKNLYEIYNNFDKFWRNLTSESQIRWIGPEKGVTHLAVAAIINALWDLWSKIEKKPLWKLLVDMEPEKLVSTIDFRYISDVITPDECIKMLENQTETKNYRLNDLKENGYPAYTTQVGWIGYSDEKILNLCKEYIKKGFTAFKIKVGQNLENDIKRCDYVRQAIGWDKVLMIDANQIWDVEEAINWVKALAKFKPLWIEEPTSPDDVLGHKCISDALKDYNIGVASGEMCANRIMFKQFLQIGALQFCQIDSARIGGVNEILSVYFMAKKFDIKVCPHAGGVGLCEMVQHLQMWDYISLSGTKNGRYIEYVDQQHDQFITPAIVNETANYIPPKTPGYSTELKTDAIQMFKYPEGLEWKKLFQNGKYKNPNTQQINTRKTKICSEEIYEGILSSSSENSETDIPNQTELGKNLLNVNLNQKLPTQFKSKLDQITLTDINSSNYNFVSMRSNDVDSPTKEKELIEQSSYNSEIENLVQIDERKVIKTEWALTRINTFSDNSRTYEIMNAHIETEIKENAKDTSAIFVILPEGCTFCYDCRKVNDN